MDEQTLGRKLIEWAADEQNVLARDEHGAQCVFCFVERQFRKDTHRDYCLHLQAKGLVANPAVAGDGWIPGDERLPDDDHDVLALVGGTEHMVAWYYRDGWYWGRAERLPNVTHWRPLPPPPEQEET